MDVKTSIMGDFSTANSQAMYDRSSKSLAMGVSSGLRRNVGPVPMFFERADGPYFYDVDGHKLLDYTLGWGPLILGNNHPHVNAAVMKQLTTAYGFGAQHRGEIELAELLVRVLPGVEKVAFSNSGTEAIQVALRLARTFTGRSKVIKFEGHYHGWLNNVNVSYRPKPTDPCIALPACGGQPAAEFSETLVLPWNDLDSIEHAFREHPGEIACVLTEPILANGGSCMPYDGYLQGIVDLCRKHGAVSIFDEVITGFRIAMGGAREYFGVTPDLSVYAKALAAGFTLSAIGGRAEIFRVLDDGRTIHVGTYNGNPISLAAAKANVETLVQPGTFDRMHAHGMALRDRLEHGAKSRDIRLTTTGVGSVFSMHFGIVDQPRTYRDVLKVDAVRFGQFRLAMLRAGVQILPDGRWYVGATHGDTELRFTEQAIDGALEELRK